MSSSTRTTVRQLRADTAAICLPKGRKVGSAGHKKARKYLTARLEEIGCEPYQGTSFELPYQRNSIAFYNVVGVVRGNDPKLPPLLVGAHYDSVIAPPCADDNAAAVAIALAAASPAFWVGLAAMVAVIANRLLRGFSHPHPPERTRGGKRFGDRVARGKLELVNFPQIGRRNRASSRDFRPQTGCWRHHCIHHFPEGVVILQPSCGPAAAQSAARR